MANFKCTNCILNTGTNKSTICGIYVYSCGCREPCTSCESDLYKIYSDKCATYSRVGCWGGGWHPSLGIPEKFRGLREETHLIINKIGYKFIRSDMTSHAGQHSVRTKKWKLGELHKIKLTHSRPLGLCRRGFHSSDRPCDAYDYISNSSIILKVERSGKMLQQLRTPSNDSQKVVSEKMKAVAIAWVKDIIDKFKDALRSEKERLLFDETILARLDNKSTHYFYYRYSSDIQTVVTEIKRFKDSSVKKIII